jgi:exosortase A-associated hydrolase 2
VDPRDIRTEPFFLDGPRDRLFCLHYSPASRPVCGTVLYLPPFGEEMHKSRRMAALQARALARAGYAVLQFDLSGCGDSFGDFADATWSRWCADAVSAATWLQARHSLPIIAWGLRLGAVLAVDVQRRCNAFCRLVLWQPVVSGDLYLTQFLRLKLATEMLAAGDTATGTKALRAALDDGQPVEVGGYQLGPPMARELSALKLGELIPNCAVDWLEIAQNAIGTLSPASERVVAAWQTAEIPVNPNVLAGEPFWATQEIVECPALLAETLKAFTRV